MKNKYCLIDFEFSGVAEPKLKLICCSLRLTDVEGVEEVWLDNSDTSVLKNRLLELNEQGYIFVSFGVSAEASSLYSLDLNPTKFKWICLMAEYRCLSNHNHNIQYGKHYIDGKVKYIFPPKKKWEEKDPNEPSAKIKHSLAECTFKFLGILIDTERKELMREICIRANDGELEENKKEIMEYCTSDLDYLMPILKEMMKEYKSLLEPQDFKSLVDDMLTRGKAMAHTAIMERHGYPIAYNDLRNFTLQIQDILNECIADINSQFPEMGLFVYNKKSMSYTMKQKPLRDWIDELPYADRWDRTAKGAYSLSLDAFTAFFSYRHDYPRFNLGAQIVRYLKLKQSLNGFSPKKKGKNFWDSVGSDLRVRAYLNAYGSQSARYQPPSTAYLFLKPSWVRALCQPPKGRMVVGTDYSSQEFLISALVSGDKKMLKAYSTGDVYTSFGKDIGLIPKDGNKKTHPRERQICKATVLGLSYKMSKYGLSIKLSQDLGEEVTPEQAQEYIDLFNENYEEFYDWGMDYLEEFSDRGYDRLPDGWIMFGDNENHRSVGNFPIQGLGSCILRKAVSLAHQKGLQVCVVLHDALYIECDLGDWDAVKSFNKCMREAFASYFTGWRKEEAYKVGLDTECWSKELEEGSRVIEGVNCSLEKIHIDPRGLGEYEKFSRYFKPADWMVL